MRCFLRLEVDEEDEARLVGLWTPGFVFCCLGGGRRAILLVEDEVGFCRDAVDEEEERGFEDLGDGLLPLVEGLTAIERLAKSCSN